MEIESLKGIPDGGFNDLPLERRERLLAWYRVRVDPDGKKRNTKKAAAGRGREVPGKRPPRRGKR